MSSTMGEKIKVTIFGQSHGEAIGVVVDNIPPGEPVDEIRLQEFMKRRSSANNILSTARKESDMPKFLSGLVNGITCGAPLCANYFKSRCKI